MLAYGFLSHVKLSISNILWHANNSSNNNGNNFCFDDDMLGNS